jgi:transposase InsO family protein
MLRFNIKKGDVIVLLSLLLMEYKIEGITLRNDNGSQFIAGLVRQFLKDKDVNQEFTHVATPEKNAYIQALHSNVQHEVVERFEFESIYHAQMILTATTTGIIIIESMAHWVENPLNSTSAKMT